MTVTGEKYIASTAGDNIVTAFAFNGNVYVDTSLTVVQTLDSTGVDTLQVITTDYTVALAVDFTSATVNMVVAPPVGTTLHIYRNEPDTQTLDYVLGGEFPAGASETSMDKLALQSQTLSGLVDTAIKIPSTKTGFNTDAGKPTALYVIRANAANDGVEWVNPTAADGVTGAVSSTDNALSRWNGVGGDAIQDSGVIVDDSDNMSGIAALTTTGTVNSRTMSTDGSKLDGIEALAEVNPTDAETKTAYEANADTNNFDDAAQTKLSGIEALADVTDATNVVASLSGATLTTIPLWAITAVTGAGTATINVYHTLGDSGGGDYTEGLPAAGNVGDRIAFYALTGLTEIVTIDPNAAETIGGATTYQMAANDFLLIEDDGTNWRIIQRTPGVYVTADSNAGQSTTSMVTNLQYEDNITDTHQAWTGNDTFNAPRTAHYTVTCSFGITASSGGVGIVPYVDASMVDKFGPTRVATGSAVGANSFTIRLNVGEALTFRINASATRTSSTDQNWITIKEVI